MADKNDLIDRLENALKIGARNSRTDKQRLQDIHDLAVMNGAGCDLPKSLDLEALVSYGSPIKATRLQDGSVKLAGYLIRFGDATKTDLTGDYFTAETDFGFEGETAKSASWFNHRLPVEYKKRSVTYREQLPDATLKKDALGIFAEIVIGARNEYEKLIAELGLAGKLGWSSGTAPHLVDRKTVGGASEITRWILGADSSLTPTPAEPRNSVIPIKMLIPSETDRSGVEPISEAGDIKPVVSESNQENLPMNEEERKALLAEVKGVFDDARSLMREETREIAKEAAQDVVKSLPEIKTAMNIQVTEAAEDRPFKSLADNCLAIRENTIKGAAQADNDYPRLRYLKATGAASGTPQDGAVLIDPKISSEIITPIHEDGPFTSAATKLPAGGALSGWVPAVDETSRVAGSRWGGIRGYRVGEGTAVTASKPSFKRLNWELKKYMAVAVATDELLKNAPMWSTIVKTGVTEELIFMSNEDIWNGQGISGAYGFLECPALIQGARDTASKILGVDVSGMYYRMDIRARSKAVWYVSNEAGPQLDALFAVGSTAVLFPYASIGPDGVRRLYGRPVVTHEFGEALNTAGDIVFADMSQYFWWDQGGIEETSSIHVYYLTDETAFRFVYMADGKPAVSSALTPLKGSTTTSPFVSLTSAT